MSACSDDKNSKSDETTTTVPKVGKRIAYEECGKYLCATEWVPLNYDKPKGRKINIAIKTLSAADPKKRKGILLINPGGPGASGRAEFVSTVESLVSRGIFGFIRYCWMGP